MRRRHRDRETIDRCSAGKIPTELFHDPSSRRLRANLRWYRRLSESTYLSCNCPKCRWYLRRGTMSPFLGGRHQSSHVLPTSIGRQRVHPRIGRMSLCKYLFHSHPKCHYRLHPSAIVKNQPRTVRLLSRPSRSNRRPPGSRLTRQRAGHSDRHYIRPTRHWRFDRGTTHRSMADKYRSCRRGCRENAP